MAISGKLIHVAWDDETPPRANEFLNLYSRSTNSGSSFSNPKGLVKSPVDEALDVKVAASGKYVYVVWNGGTPNGDFDVYIRISKDGGKNFGSQKNLSNDDLDSGNAFLRASGNNVYVAWQNNVGEDNQDIFFRMSTNKGSSFSSVKNLSNDPTHSFDPIISSSGNTLYTVWQDEDDAGSSDIFFKRSTDNGKNFESTIDLSTNPLPSFEPAIAKEGSNVYVAWIESEGGQESEVFFRRSADLGNSFGEIIDISNAQGRSVGADMTASNGVVYITWIEQSNGNGGSELMFTKSLLNSITNFQKQPSLLLPNF